jgi:hypothetical protein
MTQSERLDTSAEVPVMGPLDGSLIHRQAPATELRPEIPHTARMYDYYLGGKTNYAAGREAAEQVLATFPHMRTAARHNRAFLHRTVRYLADAGIDQFLDIGAGIPTPPNLHEVAQAIRPTARVVYVDNDRCKSGCTHAPGSALGRSTGLTSAVVTLGGVFTLVT